MNYVNSIDRLDSRGVGFFSMTEKLYVTRTSLSSGLEVIILKRLDSAKYLAMTSLESMSDEELLFNNINKGYDLVTVEEFTKVIDKELESEQL
jgi:hypothetical protein